MKNINYKKLAKSFQEKLTVLQSQDASVLTKPENENFIESQLNTASYSANDLSELIFLFCNQNIKNHNLTNGNKRLTLAILSDYFDLKFVDDVPALFNEWAKQDFNSDLETNQIWEVLKQCEKKPTNEYLVKTASAKLAKM